MVFIAIIIGCLLGAIIGINAPTISYTYSSYLAIAIIAALDSVFGGIASVINKKFDIKIFISGFFWKCNFGNIIDNTRTKVKCRHIFGSNSSICMENV